MQEITERRKRLILELADGHSSAFPFIHMLEHFVRREDIYNYLLRNGIKGKKLCEFFFERSSSVLRVSKDIISELDNKRKDQIIAGVDMI